MNLQATSPYRTLVAIGVLIACAFATYWGWLGWDDEYQTDPRTGVTSGPYETWQVVGCVLTLAATAVAAGAVRYASAAVAILPSAFTVAWTIPARAQDDTGLYGVGALMIMMGMLAGTSLVAFGTQRLLSAVRLSRTKRTEQRAMRDARPA